MGLVHYWQKLLDDGKYRSLTEIAGVEDIDLGQASRIAQLARLAPTMVESCLVETHNVPKLEAMARVCLPLPGPIKHLSPVDHAVGNRLDF